MLTSAYFLSLFALFVQCVFVPKLNILAFSPFLSLSMMLSSFRKAFFLSILAGATMDIFSSDPMGIHAVTFALLTFFLHRFKKHFLYDQPFHLSLFTFFVSSLLTVLQLLLLFLFDRRVPFSGRWIFTDLIGMPILDALYAFVWFSAPFALFQTVKKFVVVFWLKRKNRSLTSH